MTQPQPCTRQTLDEAFWATVRPGHAGATRALGIRPACHPEDGVDVFYRSGRLQLWCHGCGNPFMTILVKE
jgi:hypothetical protein